MTMMMTIIMGNYRQQSVLDQSWRLVGQKFQIATLQDGGDDDDDDDGGGHEDDDGEDNENIF